MDYTKLSKVINQNLILKYTIIDDKVFIKYVNGKVLLVPYKVGTEKIILKQMKKQMLDIYAFSYEQIENIKSSKKKINVIKAFLAIDVLAMLLAITVTGSSLILFLVALVAGGGGLVRNQQIIKEANDNLADLSNNEVFLSNIDTLRAELCNNIGKYVSFENKRTEEVVDKFVIMDSKGLAKNITNPVLDDADIIPESAIYEIYDIMIKNSEHLTENNKLKKRVLCKK